MSQISQKSSAPAWKRLLFSTTMLEKSYAKRIAYIAVFTALLIVANMFVEFKFSDVQFSVTIYLSVMTGMFIGPLFGFAAVFLGDLVGFFYNSWGFMYMPWVGLSCAVMALISGLIMNGIPLKFRGASYVKLAVVCIFTFLVCTVGINSTGFYFYNRAMGFSEAVMNYITERFGGEVTYLGYCFYRLFFKGQIFNSLFNYALLFCTLPVLRSLKFKIG